MIRKNQPAKIKQFSDSKQQMLDQLLSRNCDGALSKKEIDVLNRLVAEAERLMVANAKKLAEFARRDKSGSPSNAVPLTVWVTPANVEK